LRRSFTGAEHELLEEARAMARLTHPSIRMLFAGEEFDGQTFLVMEFVDGQTLAQWLQTPRPWQQVAQLLVSAGRGLAAAHAAGVVHRDLKPSNILVTNTNQAKVGDFGLAHLDQQVSTGIAGTAAYMAPEQRRGAQPNALADQFSFAVTFAAALPADAPARLRELLAKASANNPSDRFVTVDALLVKLERLLAPRRTATLTLSALAVALTVGAVGFVVERSRRCEGFEAQLSRVWGGATEGRLEASLRGHDAALCSCRSRHREHGA
jgi:serine/threonine protein kinase